MVRDCYMQTPHLSLPNRVSCRRPLFFWFGHPYAVCGEEMEVETKDPE